MSGAKEEFYCHLHGWFDKDQAIKIHISGKTTAYCPACVKDLLDLHIISREEYEE